MLLDDLHICMCTHISAHTYTNTHTCTQIILLHKCETPEYVLFSSSNVGDFSREVKMLASLQDTDNSGERLLDAARGLIGAFSDLLKAAEPNAIEVTFISNLIEFYMEHISFLPRYKVFF